MTARAALEAIATNAGNTLDPATRSALHRRGWAWYVKDHRGMVFTVNGRAALEAVRRHERAAVACMTAVTEALLEHNYDRAEAQLGFALEAVQRAADALELEPDYAGRGATERALDGEL